MVRALLVQEEQRSRLKLIINEAKGAGEGPTEWTVAHTRRESNGVARAAGKTKSAFINVAFRSSGVC